MYSMYLKAILKELPLQVPRAKKGFEATTS
jgi:hypothetical protein